MNPRLIAIAGPVRGLIFDLCAGETFVGRDGENTISIKDRSVSRRHCLITGEGASFRLKDLDSHNGTYVNDVPVNEQALEQGDRIKIGSSYFIFAAGEEQESPTPAAVQLDKDVLVTGSTVHVRLEDALGSMAHDLSVLMKVSTALAEAASLEELERRLIESAFEAVPADRGAILLSGEDLDAAAEAFALERHSGARRPFKVSRTVLQQVLKGKEAVLGYDIMEAGTAITSESLVDAKIRSLLCVPLRLREEVIGAIYLDTHSGRLNESHLRMMAALAGFAAPALEGARRVERLRNENRRLRDDIRIEHKMVGESGRMAEVYRTIAKVAPSGSTVLIRGESGTGKELAARAIHDNSPRAHKPFVAINCAALTETLLESELFGHERGAFTGAVSRKEGRLEAADGGTVFLDEIGEMPVQLQSKLLRVLQEREFERVGGTRPHKVDIRVIAATNRELEEAVAQRAFRQDLYYRLNVISLTMPPLRERLEDVHLLAMYFVAKYSGRCKRQVTGLSAEARECLTSYYWPGNVRELENAIERAVVLGTTERILPEDLPEVIAEYAAHAGHASYHEAVKEMKRQLILDTLRKAEGNHPAAARLLGIHPNNLHRLMRNLQLKPTPSK
jgi:Nif-specific regulatory protein